MEFIIINILIIHMFPHYKAICDPRTFFIKLLIIMVLIFIFFFSLVIIVIVWCKRQFLGFIKRLNLDLRVFIIHRILVLLEILILMILLLFILEIVLISISIRKIFNNFFSLIKLHSILFFLWFLILYRIRLTFI